MNPIRKAEKYKTAEYITASCYGIESTRGKGKGRNPMRRAENHETTKHIKSHLCCCIKLFLHLIMRNVEKGLKYQGYENLLSS